MADIRDLVTKMNKSRPYKYFMVCLVGGVRTNVSINYMRMNVNKSFTNRLQIEKRKGKFLASLSYIPSVCGPSSTLGARAHIQSPSFEGV